MHLEIPPSNMLAGSSLGYGEPRHGDAGQT